MRKPEASPTTQPPSPGHPGPGTGAEVWLFRHGEVHEDWQGKAYGGLDVPLSARGEAETREVAKLFGAVPFTAVISSDLQRAHAIGSQLAEHSGAVLEVTPGLREIARGHWQGRTVADLHAEFPDEVASLETYVSVQRSDQHAEEIRSCINCRVKFLPYDWRLNDRKAIP